MTSDCLKLTVHFGESDRAGSRPLADELVDRFAEHEVRAAALVRGVEGFGSKRELRSDRFLTASEDLPLVAVAVDEEARIEALLPQVSELVSDGLITLERARLLGVLPERIELPEALHEATQLTLYLGRGERVNGRPACLAVIDHLHRQGLAGATVLLGVDGVLDRRRQRARFFSRNAAVPLLVIGVGDGETVIAALESLRAIVPNPIATLERVRVCKRDGAQLAKPQNLPERDDAGRGIWQKLMVYTGERARHDGRPLHIQLIRSLREQGASGATSLRGIWGFYGDHAPHGDRLGRLHRNLPMVTTIVDAPDAIQRSFRIIDELTGVAGLVTSEVVPAYLAIGPESRVGGLDLGRMRF